MSILFLNWTRAASGGLLESASSGTSLGQLPLTQAHHSGSNLHRHQFLEKKLASIRHSDLDRFVTFDEDSQFIKITCDIFVLLLHERHSKVLFRKFAIHIRPHKLQT